MDRTNTSCDSEGHRKSMNTLPAQFIVSSSPSSSSPVPFSTLSLSSSPPPPDLPSEDLTPLDHYRKYRALTSTAISVSTTNDGAGQANSNSHITDKRNSIPMKWNPHFTPRTRSHDRKATTSGGVSLDASRNRKATHLSPSSTRTGNRHNNTKSKSSRTGRSLHNNDIAHSSSDRGTRQDYSDMLDADYNRNKSRQISMRLNTYDGEGDNLAKPVLKTNVHSPNMYGSSDARVDIRMSTHMQLPASAASSRKTTLMGRRLRKERKAKAQTSVYQF